ncbi:potassium channel, sub T, member 2 [Mortierella sp. AD094]|nr:potassium channel, sub T, member 2 [Mortierella sp. AD094]
MNPIPNKSSSSSATSPIPSQQSAPQPPRTTQPTLHPTYSTPPTNSQVPWSRASTQIVPPNSHEYQDSSENTANGSTLTWTQRLNYIAHNKYIEPQGFIWDSLDDSMEDVQKAKRMRKSGPIRLITDRKDTSYNALRSTFRLQNAEKRKSNIKNFVSLIRLVLDYDVYKARVMALLNSKARKIIFIMIDLVVDVLFCILYLVEAQYLISKDTVDYPEPAWLFNVRPRPIWVIAVAMSSWNLMSAVIRFIFADNNRKANLMEKSRGRLSFIFSIQTLLDVVTAIPFLLSGAFMPYGQWIYVPYFLRSWSVISRLQRALSIGVDIGISDQPFDPVKAKLVALVAYFVAILYNGTAAFLFAESRFAPKTETPHTVGDAFYFIFITASTVGYGDITPKTFEGKIVVMVFIIVALSVVPGLIAGTIETLKSSRSGGGSYLQSRGINGVAKKYLVMIGDFQNVKRVSDMLGGFFNKEFSDIDVRLVFLSRNKPSKDVKTLLEMTMHKNKTTMLVGNGLDEVDLKRYRTASHLESQDTMTTLLAWSLHLYAPNTRVFTFNLLPETEIFQWGIVEKSMCINDVKQLLLAYSCRHRGTATLILNLLHPSEPSNSYDDGWEAQYGDGTGNEIYVGSVPEVFVGWTFAQASWFIFQEFQSILIGVDIFLKLGKSASDDPRYTPMSNDLPKPRSFTRDNGPQGNSPEGRYHLTLNPGNSYRLGEFDQLVFIAQSPEDMDVINNFTVEQYDRLLSDENGRLNSSRTDFARAMNMYHSLRESRAGARAAAKRRLEHRKGKKARNPDQGPKQEQTGPSEASSSDKSSPTEDTKPSAESSGSLDTSKPKPTDIRPKKMTHKNSRPAWNVALYDDDDEDDDESLDENSLRRISSAPSGHSSQSYNPGHVWQRGKNNLANQRQSLEYRNNDENPPVGALDREESDQNGQETIPMSDSRLWPTAGGSNRGTFRTISLALSDAEFYPSNFHRNAAAAAAEDSRLNSAPSRIQEKPLADHIDSTLPNDKMQAATKQRRSVPTTVATDHSAGTSVGAKTGAQVSPSTVRQPETPWTLQSHGSFQYTYQPLDETTFIGQTLATRSETMDLPLCHLLISPPESIKSLIRDDLSLLKEHIVVCANVGENLYRFLATLRLAQIPRGDIKTIVVLTANPYETLASDGGTLAEMEEDMDQSAGGTWDAILSFPRVYWVVGNCRRQRDLVRAGILGASSIVVMSHRINGLDRDEFEDSTAIMAHHMIHQTLQLRNLLGRQHIVVEIFERSNIRFLNMRGLSSTASQPFKRLGAISKFNQTNYNNDQGRTNSGGFWMTPIFASGQVLVSSLLDNVLFQAYSKAHILDLVKLCCGVRFKQAVELDQILGIDCSNICLIDPPALSVGKPFIDLFQTLALGYGIVPLGLYRAPDPDLNNPSPFVFTNPLPGILLKSTDKIYVLKS